MKRISKVLVFLLMTVTFSLLCMPAEAALSGDYYFDSDAKEFYDSISFREIEPTENMGKIVSFDVANHMYCRMLDAMLSKGQEDENGILFVCFPVTAIAAVLSRSPMTVKRSLNELETAGLIMRVRQGVGEPNRIYVLIPGKEDAALD